jgi:hypothetical protein
MLNPHPVSPLEAGVSDMSTSATLKATMKELAALDLVGRAGWSLTTERVVKKPEGSTSRRSSTRSSGR